jgi:large subunit ribosomal protein L23
MATHPLQKNIGVHITTPRITEKATFVAEKNVYTFNITSRATKTDIAKEIKQLYKVTPLKVAVVTMKKKTVLRRGKVGTTGGGRKAYVYLKKGDKIELA